MYMFKMDKVLVTPLLLTFFLMIFYVMQLLKRVGCLFTYLHSSFPKIHDYKKTDKFRRTLKRVGCLFTQSNL